MSTFDLASFSAASAALVAAAAGRVVAVSDGRRRLSGVIWSEGRIVTAEECLGEEEGLAVVLPDGRSVTADLVGRDPSTDVALLAAETGAASAWPAAAEAPAAGAFAWVVGRGQAGPRAAFGMVAEAGPEWVSAAGGRIDARLRVQLPLPPAIEGGAAVDAAGALLGLAVADPRRRTLVIPAATVARSVAALAERGYVARGYLGLALQPIRRGAGGLIAVEVAEGGPASAAGLLVGDIVTTWEGEAVGSLRGLSRRLGPDAAGRRVRLGIVRAGQPAEVALTVGERRPGKGKHVAAEGA
jgi:S1-C subfamily serine protease